MFSQSHSQSLSSVTLIDDNIFEEINGLNLIKAFGHDMADILKLEIRKCNLFQRTSNPSLHQGVFPDV